MATVHLARQTGLLGHSRVVAIKRLRSEYARDPEFVAMLLDEARLMTRVRHANVVPLLDVVAEAGELWLVLEYVSGVPLGWLAAVARDSNVSVPLPIIVAIGLDLLDGLHAIHGAADAAGAALQVVHRDVSPQNVLVGDDGLARLLDLGIAKAKHRAQTTRGGELKGKLAYMAPEQLELRDVDLRADVFAAAVVLWELCAGRRLHQADSAAELLDAIAQGPASFVQGRDGDEAAVALEAELRRALCYAPAGRHATALELAQGLRRACAPAPRWEVREWVSQLGGGVLAERAALVRAVEQAREGGVCPASVGPGEAAAEPLTKRSGDSQTGVTAAAGRRSRSGAGGWLLAVFGVAAVALLAVGWRQRVTPTVSAQGPRSALAPAAAASTAPPPAAPRETSPVPQAVAAPELAPPPVASNKPSAPRPSVRPQRAPASAAPPAPAAPSNNACSLPYRIDASGVKVYKEECL